VEPALTTAGRLCEAGAYAEALTVLDDALRIGAETADLHTSRGWALENLGTDRLAEARVAYVRALALEPDRIWARAGLANVVGRLGDEDAAALLYQEVITQATAGAAEDPTLLELLGWSQYQLGRHEEAVHTFLRALQVDDAWVSVRFDLGLALLALGRARDAVVAYGTALRFLAEKPANERPGTLAVTLEDLDQALERRPALVGLRAVREIRARLVRASDGSWDADV
jgi:Flp pilus assembly protein TadD